MKSTERAKIDSRKKANKVLPRIRPIKNTNENKKALGGRALIIGVPFLFSKVAC